MRGTTSKLIGIALGVALALALAATPALATTVSISSGNRIAVTGEGSEINTASLFYDAVADVYTVIDGAGADGSGMCTDVTSTIVTCPGANIAAVTVRTGSSADVIAMDASMPANIEGTLDGGTGNDLVYGGKANDAVNGGSNNDFIYGGDGADDMRGGGGRDLAYYANRSSGIVVTVGSGDQNDGGAPDQSGAARDTVRGDVETIAGTVAGDAITGDSSDETLNGGMGDDILNGGRGGDTLNAGAGNDSASGAEGGDVVRGEDGNDGLSGGPDSDRVIGGPGNDFLAGGTGVDGMAGKSGIDRIFAKDGTRDRRINCGAGPNRLERAKRDKKLDPKARRC